MSGRVAMPRSLPARALVIVAAVALAVCAYGAVFHWPAFVRSWLAAAVTFGALPLGAIAILMAHGLTGGRWGAESRRAWLALAALMPIFGLALLPLWFGLDLLFPWTAPVETLPEVVKRKLIYLNEPFFMARSVLYFAIWLVLAWRLGAWRENETTAGAGLHGPGLIAWLLTLTFFGFDWLLSLEPKFYTDIFGLILATGTINAGFAAGLLLTVRHLQPDVRRDLANLWLAGLAAWAFMMFSQLIIIWSGNLPDEILWYLHRREAPWGAINWVALVLFLVLPFVILLSTAAKESGGWLTLAAVSCLAGHLLYVQWLVLPAFEHPLAAQAWLGPAAMIALGAICAAVAGWRWRGRGREAPA